MEDGIVFNNLGNDACYKGGDCDNCEFRISRKSGPGIATVLSGERGDFEYCEKGFRRVDT